MKSILFSACMIFLPLLMTDCRKSSTPSSGTGDPLKHMTAPLTKQTGELLSEAERLNGDITGATRQMVGANNYVIQCKFLKEGDLAAAEKKLKEKRDALAALQGKALELFAKAEKADPKNPAVPKAHARMRWLGLVASVDMTDEDDGHVRQERTEEVNKTLADLDTAISLAPADADSLILKGRVVLLDWVEISFPLVMEAIPERLNEFGFRMTGGVGTMLSPLDGPTGIPAACDRAIADLTRAITIHPNDPQGYFWRGMAFYYKVITATGDQRVVQANQLEKLKASVGDELDMAKKNIEQARFLKPQDEGIKKKAKELSEFWNRFIVLSAPIAVDVFPVKTAQEVFRDASPAVVLIQVQLDEGTATGSGSIVNKNGLILTNKHVIAGAQSITVTLKDGRRFEAERVAEHETYDLALIRLSGASGTLPVLGFAYEAPKVGEDVLIIGHPKGMQWSLTAGKVSQLRDSTVDHGKTIYLQTDAAANPGNSGGPILNMRGFIVAVVTMKFDETEGMSFAIYRDVAEPFVRRYE